jgi:hypothetical protein
MSNGEETETEEENQLGGRINSDLSFEEALEILLKTTPKPEPEQDQ